MAKSHIARIRHYSKPTFIYVLTDPDTLAIRYVGKTVKTLKVRLAVHIWQAINSPRKRHVLAWICSLVDAGRLPAIRAVEVVPPMEDWVEAEQRWIATLLDHGHDLCNLTDGGEGQSGYKQSTETLAKRIKSGPEHHNYGKSITKDHLQAMLDAIGALRPSDPEWVKWWNERRKAGYTPEGRARSNAALVSVMNDPDKLAEREIVRKAAMGQFDTRVAIGVASRKNWQENRDEIIAAQNLGKGSEWKRKQSEIRTALWKTTEYRTRVLEARRLAFIHKRRKPITT